MSQGQLDLDDTITMVCERISSSLADIISGESGFGDQRNADWNRVFTDILSLAILYEGQAWPRNTDKFRSSFLIGIADAFFESFPESIKAEAFCHLVSLKSLVSRLVSAGSWAP
jgi:hypothetical protein